jgi:hypothetical protein
MEHDISGQPFRKDPRIIALGPTFLTLKNGLRRNSNCPIIMAVIVLDAGG